MQRKILRAAVELGNLAGPVVELVGYDVDDLAFALQLPGACEQLCAEHRFSKFLSNARPDDKIGAAIFMPVSTEQSQRRASGLFESRSILDKPKLTVSPSHRG
jgi:hypothetical protein